jgi:hypothetical protein
MQPFRHGNGLRSPLEVRLAALALAALPTPALARATQLGHHHGLVELGDGTEDLADKLGCGAIVEERIRAIGGDQLDPAFSKLGEANLLHHQVAREPVGGLHDNGAGAGQSLGCQDW